MAALVDVAVGVDEQVEQQLEGEHAGQDEDGEALKEPGVQVHEGGRGDEQEGARHRDEEVHGHGEYEDDTDMAIAEDGGGEEGPPAALYVGCITTLKRQTDEKLDFDG